MKKNSFKRFLAVTLAAATALTFAPVSTLGLSGVIEAQAAAATLTAIDADGVAAQTGAATLDVADLTKPEATATLNITGLTSGTSKVKVSGLTDTGITAKVGTKALTENTASDEITETTATITFTGAATSKSGTVTVEVLKNGTDTAVTDTIAFTVKNSKAAITFTGSDSKETSSVSTSVNGTANVTAKYSGIAGDKVYLSSSDDSIASVSASSAITNGTTALSDSTEVNNTLTIKGNGEGTATITMKVGSVKKLFTVTVLGSKTVSGAKVTTASTTVPNGSSDYVVGNVVLTGTNLSSTVAANKPSIPSNGPTVSAVGTVTGSGTASYGDVTVSADGKTATFPIKVTITNAKAGEQYKVTVPAQTVNGASFAATDITVTIATPASTGFTYGGVLTSILAYKNASYDLAEHASISYAAQGSTAVNLTASELTWYLVDATKTPTVGEQRADLKQLNIPATDGTIAQGSTGSLKVTVADANKFTSDVNNKAVLVAEATVNGVRTVVYVSDNVKVTEIAGNVATINNTISASVSGTGVVDSDNKISVLDNQIANPTQDNKYLTADQVTYPVDQATVQSNTKYGLNVVKGSGTDNPFKGSYLTLSKALTAGTYYETAYIPFKVNGDTTNTTYIQKVNITVSVNTGVNFRIKDGGSILTSTFKNDTIATDPTVYLNLADAKTWNIKDHVETDAPAGAKVDFAYRSDSANVDVDSNGVLTAKSVGNAIIYVKATYNNITTAEEALQVRVNKNGFDTITVTGKDGDQARVLDPRDYDNNSVSVVTSEENLVTKQIPYVQIEITGNETTNVTETPVVASKNNAKLTYAFVNDYTSKGLNIDPATGKITIDYTKCTNGTSSAPATAMGVYAVKVVSAETNSSAATTSYYYVVVDYPDQTIRGLQDAYTVGSCADATDVHANAVELFDESKTTASNFRTVNKTSDDFNGINYYKDDNTKAFDMTASEDIAGHATGFAKNGIIVRAYSVGQTEHVLAYNGIDLKNKSGYTAKLITVKSAAAVDNYVTKIVNKTTGETLYDSTVNATDTAKELKINKATTIQVTLAHPVASVASGSAVGLKIKEVRSDGSSVINQAPYVTAVKNSKQVDVALYPNTKGTTVIEVGPSGHLTATDRTDIHQKSVKLAITYTGENASVTKPAKVTGVKVSNKKGAKVTVSYKKVTTAPTMKYYVQKKIGKKTSGKSVGSTKATLSVKKGATVKVRVKAYYYDASGKKHVGAYSAWKTLKTDKK